MRNEWTSPSHRFSPLVALCGVGFLGRLSYEMARTPLTPLYAKHLGAPTALIGLIVAAVTITGIVVKLPAGALSDLFGFRRLMFVGALVKASGPFLYLLTVSWPQLLAVRRLGTYSAAENAGVVLGPVIGGVALTASSFTGAFVVSCMIGVLALLTMRWIPRGRFTTAPTTEQHYNARQAFRDLAAGVGEIVADPAIRLVSLSAGLPAPVCAERPHPHLADRRAGRRAGSRLDRQSPVPGQSLRPAGRKPLIVSGAVLCIATLIAVPHTGSFLVLLGLSTFFGLGTGMVTPATTAMIGDLVTKGNYGSAMGVFGSLWDTGHAAGPVLFGFLLVALGYRDSWLIMAAALLIFLARTIGTPATKES